MSGIHMHIRHAKLELALYCSCLCARTTFGLRAAHASSLVPRPKFFLGLTFLHMHAMLSYECYDLRTVAS